MRLIQQSMRQILVRVSLYPGSLGPRVRAKYPKSRLKTLKPNSVVINHSPVNNRNRQKRKDSICNS